MAAANPYELQRQRIKSESQAQAQGQNEALKRRFARMGAMNSGAAIKASERLAGQQEQNQQRALEGVDVQESLAAEQKAEAERGRQFARGERLGSQEFSREERLGSQGFQEKILGKQQTFAKSEREAGQGFQARLMEDQQAFTSGEREATQAFAKGEREAGQLEQRRLLEDTQAFQKDQFDRQFGLDEEVSRFNMDMANKIFEKKDFMEKALDPFGNVDQMGANKGALGQVGGWFTTGGQTGGGFKKATGFTLPGLS